MHKKVPVVLTFVGALLSVTISNARPVPGADAHAAVAGPYCNTGGNIITANGDWDGPASEQAEYRQLKLNTERIAAIIDRHRTELMNEIPDAENLSPELDPVKRETVILVQTTRRPSAKTIQTAPKEIEGAEVRVKKVPTLQAYQTC